MSILMYEPYKAFSFNVAFIGLPSSAAFAEMSFQSVKGLEVQMEFESLKEGGLNSFEHQIPTRAKYTTLTLERGMFVPQGSEIIKWINQGLHDFQFNPITMKVSLLSSLMVPLVTWNIAHALPKSYKIKDLNATSNEVLIETLEIQYNSFKMIKDII